MLQGLENFNFGQTFRTGFDFTLHKSFIKTNFDSESSNKPFDLEENSSKKNFNDNCYNSRLLSTKSSRGDSAQDKLYSGNFGSKVNKAEPISNFTSDYLASEKNPFQIVNPSFEISEGNSMNKSYFGELLRNVSIISSSSKSKSKKKILSSEELELQKIRAEKERVRKLKELNNRTFEKVSKLATKEQKIVNTAPLTVLKPFNLSSTNKALQKKRFNSNRDEEINQKIAFTMKKRLEDQGETINILTQQKIITPPSKRLVKKSLGKSRSQSPLENPLQEDDDVQTLSERIEKYCFVTRHGQNTTKSPVRTLFRKTGPQREEGNTTQISNIDVTSTNSFKRHFASSEDAENQNPNKSRVEAPIVIEKKPILHNVVSFESVLKTTLQEKQKMEDLEKLQKKNKKLLHIKQQSLIRRINKETFMNI